MSSVEETQTIKPLVDIIDRLLKEWIILDKDLKGDKYALKKMLVFDVFGHETLPLQEIEKPSQSDHFKYCV